MKQKEISPELYRLAEMIEKLPPSKRKILYDILEKSVYAVVSSYEADKEEKKKTAQRRSVK